MCADKLYIDEDRKELSTLGTLLKMWGIKAGDSIEATMQRALYNPDVQDPMVEDSYDEIAKGEEL